MTTELKLSSLVGELDSTSQITLVKNRAGKWWKKNLSGKKLKRRRLNKNPMLLIKGLSHVRKKKEQFLEEFLSVGATMERQSLSEGKERGWSAGGGPGEFRVTKAAKQQVTI